MKIAIMGAGLSGLSCAITLEKNGQKPVIFEKRDRVGDRFVCGEAMFNILNRPINNCLDFFKDKYDIKLKPISTIDKITIYSPREHGSIEGNLGYTNIRGRHEDAFEMQLSKQVESTIHFKSTYTYEEIYKNFDVVVIANGDEYYSSKLNNYIQDVPFNLKGATVEGNFETSKVFAWFNHDFAPKGYAYAIPFSKQEANIALAYPDYETNKDIDEDKLWNIFFDRVQSDLHNKLRITDRFQIKRYMSGICKERKIGNTYFTGNALGSITPALGFGQFNAILTGIFAAYDICGLGNYERLTEPIIEAHKRSLIIRKTMEKKGNDDYDRYIKNLDNRLVDNILDKYLGDSKDIDLIKWISNFAKPFIHG